MLNPMAELRKDILIPLAVVFLAAFGVTLWLMLPSSAAEPRSLAEVTSGGVAENVTVRAVVSEGQPIRFRRDHGTATFALRDVSDPSGHVRIKAHFTDEKAGRIRAGDVVQIRGSYDPMVEGFAGQSIERVGAAGAPAPEPSPVGTATVAAVAASPTPGPSAEPAVAPSHPEPSPTKSGKAERSTGTGTGKTRGTAGSKGRSGGGAKATREKASASGR